MLSPYLLVLLSLLDLLQLSFSLPAPLVSTSTVGSIYPRLGASYLIPNILPKTQLTYFTRSLGETQDVLSAPDLDSCTYRAASAIDTLKTELGEDALFDFSAHNTPLSGAFLFNEILIQVRLVREGEAGIDGDEVATEITLQQGKNAVQGVKDAARDRAWREEARIVIREEYGLWKKPLVVGVIDLTHKRKSGEGRVVTLDPEIVSR